jgi:hypothetical protein
MKITVFDVSRCNLIHRYKGLGENNCLNLQEIKLVRSWLRHYATSRKVAGLIPDEVIGFFN